jgi:Peptidase family M41
MKRLLGTGLSALLALCLALPAAAQLSDYAIHVVASDLMSPTGITVDGDHVYFTQVPTPGVGGSNSIAMLDLASGEITILHMGDPEPRNIVQDKHGTLFWTCTSAGVVAKRTKDGVTSLLLTGLDRPIGIAVDAADNIFFTEVPTPGVPGGENRISEFDGVATTVLHMGEPEPTDIAVAPNGDLYWTCKSAGVILRQSGGETTMFMTGLDHPSGIAIDDRGENLYFTEVPTPGTPGSAGGRNMVWRVDLRNGDRRLVHAGDPEPTDITVGRNGVLYWTCTTANVIVEARPLHVAYIPIAGSTDGVHGQMFQTNMRLFNPSETDTAEIMASFLPVGQDNSDAPNTTLSVGAQRARDFNNVVGTVFGESGLGAIRLQSETPFIATSRIYAPLASGGTVGQFEGAERAEDATTQGVIVHLRQDDAFRSNVGFLNPNGMSTDATLVLHGSDDQALGDPVDVTLAPYGTLGPVSLASLFNMPELNESGGLWLSFSATHAALGPVGYPEGGSVFLGGGGSGLSSRPFAEATQATIDAEVSRLLREAEETAVSLIRSHHYELGQLVELLLEKETVDGAEVYRIVGRPVPERRLEELTVAPHSATAAASPQPPGNEPGLPG